MPLYLGIHFFYPLPVAPVGLMKALDRRPPPVSRAAYIIFEVKPRFLLRDSCCQRKLLEHIALQSRREYCYGSMWVIL